MSELALLGGTPVRRDRPWPKWPQYDAASEQALLDALRSRRWAVSWASDGTHACERRFAEAFAAYSDVPYGVSVDHGSSALVVALEALDIGPGDEVVVPTLTWVAPVTAVLRVGALPVLADSDPETGCLTAQSIRDAMGPRTKAVIVVHLAATVADLPAITALTEDAGIHLIEDCAQAHGARWGDRAVGSFGAIGAFSFQNGKVLAGGEGGAVITADERLYRRAQQLRADSRRYHPGPPVAGTLELVEDGEVMGANYCMSELTAALLLDQLPRLQDQHRHRAKTAADLEQGLARLGGFGPIPVPEQVQLRSIYEYGVRFPAGTFGAVPLDRVAQALTAELGMTWYPPDAPLHRSVMLRPHTKRRFAAAWTEAARDRAFSRDFGGARRYCETTLLFHHSALLGDSTDADDIVAALAKVRDRHPDL
ncbi:putative PLP-dependent enzyme possibly involved in cell wall biogenesis [Frankia casuarinae]|jgi:L-glutamine:2-deoxy-scyllo-inosose/3-amino-2,3-dideoxy-scyllo-inosose aminotransferase|uniref:DegT/DnrJ/EryC1/StrS aminotransferase n=1 Tax=Frankia casuarinae (strain DSM 45818 / CECT 9043 / HFP020203 / CcI3) TaxID=106370 RepID=Q2J7M4_FRACC|nr:MULTISPECIES: DegT/DnrJ/EryC1/StrS family aminotransferase [Frankia]ABD12718.1 DegT/DnrJ/EryC1/StrS aminotransferase [Frankia casuarinae]ETA00474.1 putative PLP-dependent enzyme possibly involved in cell wall biogenesis [Frankia sp. CcI6]EYT91009.1 putative PLP-dependent enzyme possibly involved in cell wall biogenesis [Frankia casuarinae]KFB03765.1 putative PLP-dependent enzyme possibly involved in cell wall biogenesis [Frankia sp. Allo2]OAA20294.1 putative PLP-dependent enzyme [Frankia ca